MTRQPQLSIEPIDELDGLPVYERPGTADKTDQRHLFQKTAKAGYAVHTGVTDEGLEYKYRVPQIARGTECYIQFPDNSLLYSHYVMSVDADKKLTVESGALSLLGVTNPKDAEANSLTLQRKAEVQGYWLRIKVNPSRQRNIAQGDLFLVLKNVDPEEIAPIHQHILKSLGSIRDEADLRTLLREEFPDLEVAFISTQP